MAKIFIPTDRVGTFSFQKNICHTMAVINGFLKKGYEVYWHYGGLKFEETSRWPEGHRYQCGFSLEDTDILRSMLDKEEIRWETVEMMPCSSGDFFRLSVPKIAFYNGAGAGPEFAGPLAEVLDLGGFEYTYISDEEIRAGDLMDYDIFLVPGSPDSGECYYVGLGDLGHDQIRKFLREKGNYMGICGGAYFPLTSYSDRNYTWLGIVEATDEEDLDFWHKGSGLVRCVIDEPDHPLFAGVAAGKLSTVHITYWEGPAIRIVGDNVKQLGHFDRLLASGSARRPHWDFGDNQLPKDAIDYYNPLSDELFDKHLKGFTSFAEAEYGGSRIIMFSPHPEMGNFGATPRADSTNFQMIYNGLMYLGAFNGH